MKTGDEVMLNEHAEVFVLDRIKVRCYCWISLYQSVLVPDTVIGIPQSEGLPGCAFIAHLPISNQLLIIPSVAPAELEGLLLDHPDVDDACVVGVPDEYSGELPMAFIVPSPAAAKRIKKDRSEQVQLKRAIMKVIRHAP